MEKGPIKAWDGGDDSGDDDPSDSDDNSFPPNHEDPDDEYYHEDIDYLEGIKGYRNARRLTAGEGNFHQVLSLEISWRTVNALFAQG